MENNPPNQVNEISKKSAIFTLLVLTLLYVVNYMDRTVLSVTLPLIKNDLSLSDAQLGWLGTIYFLMVAVLTIPSALIVDRWSRKKSLAIMALIWSVATFLTGTGRSFGALLNARGWVGIGEAGFSPGGLAYISGSFDEKSRAKVTGIFMMGAPVGLILGALLGGLIAKANIWQMGWRTPYFFFAIPGVLLGILVFFTKDYSTDAHKEYSSGLNIFKDMRVILKFRTFWYLSLGLAAGSFANTAILQFLPLYFTRTRGWDVAKSSFMFGLMFVFAAMGSILAGIIADKWKEKKINGRPLATSTFTLISLVCITIGLVADARGYYIIGYIGFTVTAVVAFAHLSPLAAAIMDLAPLRLRSLSVALMVFIGYILGSPGSSVIGWFSDVLGTTDNPNLMAAFFTVPFFYLFAAVLFFRGALIFKNEFKMTIS